jgi:hypothetical protein
MGEAKQISGKGCYVTKRRERTRNKNINIADTEELKIKEEVKERSERNREGTGEKEI